MLDQLAKQEFAQRIGATFAATAEEGRTLALRLWRVDALPPPAGDKGHAP